jgi:hypothetical protein
MVLYATPRFVVDGLFCQMMRKTGRYWIFVAMMPLMIVLTGRLWCGKDEG